MMIQRWLSILLLHQERIQVGIMTKRGKGGAEYYPYGFSTVKTSQQAIDGRYSIYSGVYVITAR